MSIEKHAIAQGVLEEAGFSTQPEPGWVTSGQVPDFFCSGTIDLWVEVKTISEAERDQALARRARWLYDRAKTITVAGKAFAWVDEEATERHIKAGVALGERALGVLQTMSPPLTYVCAVVPHDSDFSSLVQIRVQTQKGTEMILAVRSQSGRYGRPQIGERLTGIGSAWVEDANGNRCMADSLELGLAEDDFAVGLRLEQSDARFSFSSISLTGPGQRLTTAETVRHAAKKANSQFKNACKFRSAPCLLMVFEDGIFVQEPKNFASAFYGNLQYQRANGSFSFGPDGLWSETANRTTSAACLIRNNRTPVLIVNPWASAPLPRGTFNWPAVDPSEDGTVSFPP